jgi:hypothetical protein
MRDFTHLVRRFAETESVRGDNGILSDHPMARSTEL